MSKEPIFLENHQYLPDPGWLRCGFSILRAGRVEASPDYGVRREWYPGQDLLYCLDGAGTIDTDGRRILVTSGRLVWIANERPHAHNASPEYPWTLLWIRIDGPDIVGCRRRLLGNVATGVDIARALIEPWFDRLFDLLRYRDGDVDLNLNQLVAELLVLIRNAGGNQGIASPPALDRVLARMKADLGYRWTTESMCTLAHVSPEQLRRWFRRHLATSPHRWLMRERVMHAQQLLLESRLPLSDVASACGYCDVYHLGREFKRAVGVAPATWRRSETGAG